VNSKLTDFDVKRSLQDTGYVALGVGVIGFQQAQKSARWARDELARARGQAGEMVGKVRENADQQIKSAQSNVEAKTRDARQRTASLRGELRTRVESLGDEVRGRADGLSTQAKARLEPVVDQLQQLPDQAAKAVETGRSRVQTLVPGRETSASSAAGRASASSN